MTVKASELITRALALADLTNTSFPTSTENRTYINLAFADVYQELINEGQKYYFETIEIPVTHNVTDYQLPDDFYQLYDLKDEKEQRIPRRQRNSTKNEKWYDIVKNEIKVSDRVEGKLTLEYFPKPFELDPTQTGDVDLDFPDNTFYHLVALYLARYYKIKQNADFTGIDLLIEEGWNTYRNILNRDLDQPVEITDVYENYRRVL